MQPTAKQVGLHIGLSVLGLLKNTATWQTLRKTTWGNENTTIVNFRWLYTDKNMIMNIIFNFCPYILLNPKNTGPLNSDKIG